MNEKEINVFVGDKIRELRLRKGLTQKELAEKIGMGHTTIANYEKGIRAPKKNKIFKIANVLGYSVDDFFPNQTPNQKPAPSNITPFPSSSQPEITQIYNTLSQDSKTKLLKYAKLLQEADSIEYYEVIATTKLSAGVGYAFNEDDQEKVYVENKPPYYEIASFINGDSMEPKYHSGDIVYLVDKGLSTYNGQVCAVSYQDRTYLKRVFTEKGRLRLESINPRYKDIYIDFPPIDGDYLRIYEVIGTDSTVTL
ncbi:XRE family transcriptional regulator [Streptococcus uberis]|nr:XRE family transcriptional regulator [Streptococcus uberis]MCK1242413.1 XRE family transcriptional regulator [Streptococcus uberis]